MLVLIPEEETGIGPLPIMGIPPDIEVIGPPMGPIDMGPLGPYPGPLGP